MEYATHYDVGDRKRDGGINEDSVAVSVFEEGHRDGVLRTARADATGEVPPSAEGTDTGTDDGRDDGADHETDDGSDGETAVDTPANRSGGVFVLADGAGGHDAGDVASYLATTVVCEELADVVVSATRADSQAFGVDVPVGLRPDRPDGEALLGAIEDAIVEAHREITRYNADTGSRALTTVVVALWLDGTCYLGWVGDSRAYLVNGALGRIERLTKDHAVVEELHDRGDIDDVEAQVHPRSNEIMRAIGGAAAADPDEATVEVDTRRVPLYAEDVLLVTSDGLLDAQTDARALYERYVDAGRRESVGQEVWNAVVTDDELREVVLGTDDLESAGDALIAMANDRGGYDNLSTILARDPRLPPTPTDPEPRAIDPPDLTDRETLILPDE